MFSWLSGPTWSAEDRWIKLALKIALVLGVIALEIIVVAAVAMVMWEAVR